MLWIKLKQLKFFSFFALLQVKEQHFQRAVQFLADELKVATKQEAKNRIFFVSAKEALLSRLHEDSQTPTPSMFRTIVYFNQCYHMELIKNF